MAIVARLRNSATDADVRPLAVLMGARLLLKIEADLLFNGTVHENFHEIQPGASRGTRSFWTENRRYLDLCYVSSGCFRLSRLSVPEREHSELT